MKFLTFTGQSLTTGMPVDVMVRTFEQLAKAKPNAMLDDVPAKVLLYWPGKSGSGHVLVEQAGQPPRRQNMPSNDVVLLPGDSIVRLVPSKGRGCTLSITANGAFQTVDGHDADPVPPLQPQPGDDAVRQAALAWLRTGQVGASSYALCVHLTGAKDPSRGREITEHPWDVADFRRCLQFFEAVPAAREHLDRMREVSPVWHDLVENWERLEQIYHQKQAGISQADQELTDQIAVLTGQPPARSRRSSP